MAMALEKILLGHRPAQRVRSFGAERIHADVDAYGAHAAHVAVVQQVAQVTVVRRQPALQPHQMPHTGLFGQPHEFARLRRGHRQRPFAIHVLARCNHAAHGFRMLWRGVQHHHQIHLGVMDQVVERRHHFLDAMGQGCSLGGIRTGAP